MSIQHEYRGSGAPLSVVAPVNSHYLDELSGIPWLCTWSDGVTSAWMRLRADPDVAVFTSGGTVADVLFSDEYILPDGAVQVFDIEGSIYSNVPLTGSPRQYTADSLCHMHVQPIDGGALVRVTPLTEYPAPA